MQLSDEFESGTILGPNGRPICGPQNRYRSSKWSDYQRDWRGVDPAWKSEDAQLSQFDRDDKTGQLWDLYRNNEHIGSLVEALIVSFGMPRARIRTGTDEASQKYDSSMLAALKPYFKKTQTNQRDWKDFILQCRRYRFLSGEVFVRKVKDLKSGHIGELQIINPGMIGSDPDNKDIPEGITETQGIGLDAYNTPVYYRVGVLDKNGTRTFRSKGKKKDDPVSFKIPAAEMLHYGRFVGSSIRGTPELFAGMDKLKDLAELAEAKLSQVKMAAMIALLITKNQGPSDNIQATTSTKPAAGEKDKMVLSPGSIHRLRPGENVTTMTSSINLTDYLPYYKQLLVEILAIVRMPICILYGFFDSNYASSKQDKEIWSFQVRNIREDETTYLLDPAIEWWMDFIKITKKILPTEQYFWGWTPLPSMDKFKETQAAMLQLKNGLTTLTHYLAEHDIDIEDFFEEKVAEIRTAWRIAGRPDAENAPIPDELLFGEWSAKAQPIAPVNPDDLLANQDSTP